jgi:hypothetical protein
MPLDKSGSPGAFKSNVKTLMGEIGASPHVQSRAQALAISYALKRRARAEGGPVHTGPINSIIPGRTDKHDMDVPSGSYVIPAECVSHLGENNTNAGMALLHKVCLGSPESIRKFFSAKSPKDGGWSNVVRHMRADGGHVGSPVPIRAAGGEFVMPPNVVSIIGHGDLKHGHGTLDKWVMNRRKGHIKTLKGLAPPARD